MSGGGNHTIAWPIDEFFTRRWSSRSFSSRAIEPEKLNILFEAARWAPSCFNEQPWRYVVATQDEAGEFGVLASLLVEGNAWAKSAYLLALSVAKLRFERNGKPNLHAWHDVGAASVSMALQASELGLNMHQMAGFDRQRARAALSLDDGHDPVAMIAVGFPGDPAALSETLRARETAPRERLPIDQFVFGGAWGRPARFTAPRG
jgi:nitroreductase